MKFSHYMRRARASRDPRYARILSKLGYPRRDRQPATLAKVPVDDIKALREEYKRVTGKKPFSGWDAAALREKIAEAKA